MEWRSAQVTRLFININNTMQRTKIDKSTCSYDMLDIHLQIQLQMQMGLMLKG